MKMGLASRHIHQNGKQKASPLNKMLPACGQTRELLLLARASHLSEKFHNGTAFRMAGSYRNLPPTWNTQLNVYKGEGTPEDCIVSVYREKGEREASTRLTGFEDNHMCNKPCT